MDPVTKKVESKHIKPFMVNNAVLMFEREKVVLAPKDRDTIVQFESYEVKSWGSDGRPTYTDENEHILDCIVFALYGFTKFYDDILKVTKSAAVRTINEPLDRMKSNIKDRDIQKETQEEKQTKRVAAALGIKPNRQRSSESRRGYTSVRRSMGMPARKSF